MLASSLRCRAAAVHVLSDESDRVKAVVLQLVQNSHEVLILHLGIAADKDAFLGRVSAGSDFVDLVSKGVEIGGEVADVDLSAPLQGQEDRGVGRWRFW